MSAESVSKEEATEQDDGDHGTEAEKTQPMGPEWSPHVVQIDMSTFCCGWSDISIAGKDCACAAGIYTLAQ